MVNRQVCPLCLKQVYIWQKIEKIDIADDNITKTFPAHKECVVVYKGVKEITQIVNELNTLQSEEKEDGR